MWCRIEKGLIWDEKGAQIKIADYNHTGEEEGKDVNRETKDLDIYCLKMNSY
jgi:hypothetical protein